MGKCNAFLLRFLFDFVFFMAKSDDACIFSFLFLFCFGWNWNGIWWPLSTLCANQSNNVWVRARVWPDFVAETKQRNIKIKYYLLLHHINDKYKWKNHAPHTQNGHPLYTAVHNVFMGKMRVDFVWWLCVWPRIKSLPFDFCIASKWITVAAAVHILFSWFLLLWHFNVTATTIFHSCQYSPFDLRTRSTKKQLNFSFNDSRSLSGDARCCGFVDVDGGPCLRMENYKNQKVYGFFSGNKKRFISMYAILFPRIKNAL